MRIAIAGASGLVGSELARILQIRGDEVLRLVRRPTYGPDESRWDPTTGLLERQELEKVDAVIHLGGASIGEGRWSPGRKRLLRESRIQSTALLAEELAKSGSAPGSDLRLCNRILRRRRGALVG